MLARTVAVWIGLALVAALLFATLRGDDVPVAQSPAEEIEAARSPAPPPVLATPDALERTAAATPAGEPDSTRASPNEESAPVRHTVRGRVVDANGDPLVATVSARGFDFEGKLSFGRMAKSGTDGWFEVAHFRGGVLQLLADAEELGTGALRDVDFDSPPADPIEIVVTGPGVVRGRVLDDSGRAVPKLELGVWLAALDDDAGSFRFPEPAHSVARLEGRGRTWASVSTDAEGRFDVRGLRADRYVVRASASGRDSYPSLLTIAPVPTDGTPLELRLQRTYLAVRVVDELGEPFQGKVDSGTTDYGAGWDARVEAMAHWPKDVRVVVLPSAVNFDVYTLTNPRLVGSASGDGEFIFPVKSDRTYRVGLMGGLQPWKPVEIVVPPLAGRVEVVLRASDSVEFGTLAVAVQSPDGQVLRTGFSIRIEDPADGATLLFDDLGSDQSTPQYFRLPAGRYRVVVRGENFVDFHHGTVWGETKSGTFETEVSISRDATTRVDATLPTGARIELVLTGTILEEDNEAVRAAHPPGTSFGGPIEYWSGQATTTLWSANRWPTPVEFRYEITGSSAAGTHLGSFLTLGTRGTSERLPSGNFRFESRMPGGRVVAQDVTLVDGQTTRLVLAMPSQPAGAVGGK